MWQGTQANLADSAHQLKAGQARASEGLSGQGGAAPAAATTSAVSAAQDVSHTKPQPHRALEASAPLKSSGPPTSTAPAAQQQQGSRLANNDQLPEAAHQQQGAMQDLEQGMLRHQQQHAVAASSGLLTEVKSSQPPASASGQHSQSVVAGTQQAPGPHTAEPRQHSQGANAGGLSKSQQLSVAGSWPNRLAAMSMPDGASTSGASTSGASTGLGSIPHNNQPGHHLLHAAAAYMPQQGPSWSVQRLSNGQWVCAMDDGATLNLEQLYYTFHSVGRNLPQDKLQALGSMIEQLSRLGEKGPPLPQSAS